MELKHGAHLAYCTNIHPGRNWAETLDSLRRYTLAVRDRVRPKGRFGIGLRLSALAAQELMEKRALLRFQRWLEKSGCYVFTINGFPYGRFHRVSVKEKVYLPDWSGPERLAYTNLLFDLLAKLAPDGVAGSVSTLPGGFKRFVGRAAQQRAIRQNLWRCVEHISRLAEKSGKTLALGLEPEPLCLLENSAETISFLTRMREEYKNDPRLEQFLGVNYDCCHFAVEFEEAGTVLDSFQKAGVRIIKIHLSSALRTSATPEGRAALKKFADKVYLHQVIARDAQGRLTFFRDLPDALKAKIETANEPPEWRIHYHVPLYAPAVVPFENTGDHLCGALDWAGNHPKACPHLEMETYTWDVLPREMRSRTVVEQLAAEYDWALAQLARRGLS